ncbi:hypothetical protein B0H34DRAFT_657752 [Crassisporium funariophilum]|nr:hypothetical protein B0H34DRAFT_657752 [Crassisporium funariophilum]
MNQQSTIVSDPNNAICPDFSLEIYGQLRLMHITENPGASDADAILHLSRSWHLTNEAEKAAWQAHQAQVVADAAQLEHREREAADFAAEKLKLDQEAIRQDDMKKHKAKYLPILDREVPDLPPILASASATRKLASGAYCELFYWTNAGLTEAQSHTGSSNDKSLTFIMKDGETSLVSASAARDSRTVKPDKDLSWDDFCTAVPRVIDAMERAGWQREKVLMFAQFWSNIRSHTHASAFDNDGILRKSLLTYQDEVRRSWFTAVASGNTDATFNLARINETLLLTVQRRVEFEHRVNFDREFNLRVCSFALSPFATFR